MDIYKTSVIVFIAITMAIGFWSYFRVKGQAMNYYKAGGAMPVWVISMTLCAQAFDANGSMGATALTYDYGFWAGASIPIGLALCLFVTGAFFAEPIQKMNLMTLPDFYNRRYSKGTEAAASVSMLFSNIILIAGNLAGLALILQMIFGYPYLAMLIVITSCIFAYAVTGGIFASITTSVFQVAIFVIGMLSAFFWLTDHYGFESLMMAVPESHSISAGLVEVKNGAINNWAQLIALGLGDVVAIDFMQRVISSDSPKTAKRGCYFGGLITLAVGVPAALIGMYAFYMNKVGSSDLLANIAVNNLPTVVGTLLILGIIAASMSTAAGVILALSNVITRNLVQKNFNTNWNNNTMLMFSRLIAIPTMAAAVIFAYVRPEPGSLLILAFDVVLAGCFVPLALGIYWKKSNTPAALASIIGGGSLRLILEPQFSGDYVGLATLIPAAFSLVLFVTVALLTQKYSKPKHDAFAYRPTDEELISGRY
ncbi:sodium:solute symporter family transporter [Enterovibrio calviensis]|uniref:sodium:solute symporter family transporter n=1 Tax=Enterovibrio calviensis TaxID=91359 RepID=UPI0006874778|nr:hypothetical protein [Enterovibrio calviensis]